MSDLTGGISPISPSSCAASSESDAKPRQTAQLPIGAMVMMLVALVVAMEGVMGEAYSVWCLMGVALNLYYLAYPFLFGTPQRGKGSGAAGRRRAVKIKTNT